MAIFIEKKCGNGRGCAPKPYGLGRRNRGRFGECPRARGGANRLAGGYMAIFPVGGSKSITLQNSRISSGVPSETRMYLFKGAMTGATKIW